MEIKTSLRWIMKKNRQIAGNVVLCCRVGDSPPGDPEASGEATKLKLAERPCQRLSGDPPSPPDHAQGPQGLYYQALFSTSLEVKEPEERR